MDVWNSWRERLIIVVSGPSGSGKTTLCQAVQERVEHLFYSISATTRTPRSWEENGKDYHFVSKERFQEWIRDHNLLEWAEIYGEYYGTPAHPVFRAFEQGQDVIMDLDVVGKRTLEARFPRQVVSVFVFPPSLEALKTRLIRRGVEPGKLETRLQQASKEISHAREYTYWILNEDFEKAVNQLSAIIQASRLSAHLLLRDPLHLIQENWASSSPSTRELHHG